MFYGVPHIIPDILHCGAEADHDCYDALLRFMEPLQKNKDIPHYYKVPLLLNQDTHQRCFEGY